MEFFKEQLQFEIICVGCDRFLVFTSGGLINIVASHAGSISIVFIEFLTIGLLQLALQDTGLSLGSCEHTKVVHCTLAAVLFLNIVQGARFQFKSFHGLGPGDLFSCLLRGLCPSCEVQEKRLAANGVCKVRKVRSSR